MIMIILMVFGAQVVSSIHAHSIDDFSVEICNVCLVSQNAELDDVIPSSATSKLAVYYEFASFNSTIAKAIHSNFSLVLYLRGPPA